MTPGKKYVSTISLHDGSELCFTSAYGVMVLPDGAVRVQRNGITLAEIPEGSWASIATMPQS